MPSTAETLRYGMDGSTALGDLDTRLSLASGKDLVAQDIIARLTEEPGGLWYDQSYGAGLPLLLNESVDTATMRRAEALAEKQCRMDERVAAARVSITFNETTETLNIVVMLQLATSVQLDFTLTIDQVTGELLRV